jgi:hypothetical protein
MLDEIHLQGDDVVASWMEDRDRLVEQTRAFVAGVAAAIAPLRIAVASHPEQPQSEAAAFEMTGDPVRRVALDAAKPLTMPPRLRSIAPATSERTEIAQRVSAFRAHQARVSQEREAFYDATQSKIRNVLGNESKREPL